MTQTQRFNVEFDAWAELLKDAPGPSEQPAALMHHKRALAGFRALDHKWRLRLRDPRMRKKLEESREEYARPMEQTLEELFWQRLGSVVSAWGHWCAVEKEFRAAAASMGAPPRGPAGESAAGAERPAADAGKAADAAAAYREQEAEADAREARARAALGGFMAEWPERVGRALRERFATLDEDGAKAWIAEIVPKAALPDAPKMLRALGVAEEV